MREKGKRRRILTWVALLLLFIILIIMFTRFGGEILRIIAHIRPVFFILAMLCHLGVQLSWAVKYHLLVRRRVPRAYFPYVALANMYGNFVNITTPSGRVAGEPLRASAIAKRYRARFSTVFAATMMDKMTLTVTQIVVLIPLSVYMTLTFDMPRIVDYFLGAFIIFWIGVGIISYYLFKGMGEGRSRKIGSMIYRISRFILRGRYRERKFFIERVRSGIMEFKSSFRHLSRKPLLMLLDLSLGILMYFFRFSAAYMFFIAVGHSQPFLTVSTVVMIAFLVGLMSQLPGMVGIAESSLTGLYLATGVPVSIALTVSILSQMNVYIFEIGLGYLSMVMLNIWGGRRARVSTS